jgi:hypothetical protein
MIKLTITTKNGTTVSLDIPDTEDVKVTNSRVKETSAVVYPKYHITASEDGTPLANEDLAPSGKMYKSVEDMIASQSVDEVLARENITGEKIVGGEVGGEEGGCKGGEGEVEGREEEKPDLFSEIDHTSETALDMFQFPCQSGIYVPPMKLTKDFVLAFGNDHVSKEFLKARLWLCANTEKRKTQRGMGRFLNAWLCREAGMKRSAVASVAAVKSGSLLDNGTEDSQGW